MVLTTPTCIADDQTQRPLKMGTGAPLPIFAIPASRFQVLREGADNAGLIFFAHETPCRLRAPYRGIKKRFWTRIVGLGETIDAINRNGDDLYFRTAKTLGNSLHLGITPAFDCDQ